MSSLARKLDDLNLEEERSNMFGYIWRTKQSKKFFACKNNFYVVPDSVGSRMILCQRMNFGESDYFICLKCTDTTIFENLGAPSDLKNLKEDYCIHAKLCSVIFETKRNDTCKIPDNGLIEILHQDKEFISLVYAPPHLKKKFPGVIFLNSRTTKPKCHSCEGKKCVHINTYQNISTDNKDEEFPTRKLPNKEPRSNNRLDPSDKKGRCSNVFKIEINYPPNEREMAKINRINTCSDPFASNILVPDLKPGEVCDCESKNRYLEQVRLSNCESTKPVIHHSKALRDSQNSTLMVLYRVTGKCNCKKYYLGKEDKLLRVSGISGPSTNTQVHFVSYDILFEYLASLNTGGNTQNAFIQCKNDVNLLVRGENIEIPRHIFHKAFEIFLHSLSYDLELAWSCKMCPKPLDISSNLKEHDFDSNEVHISDGINMGTIENDVKGFTDRDIFEEETDQTVIVKGIEANERTIIDKINSRKILQNLCKSQMKSKDVKEAINKLQKCKVIPVITNLINLLKRLLTNSEGLPQEYFLLFSELSKCTPISVLFPSHDDLEYKLLEMFLAQEFDMFSEYKTTKVITNAFPVIIKIFQNILAYERSKYLPEDVACILKCMLDLKSSYNDLARERTVPRKKPEGKPTECQVYPYYPVHTVKNTYLADSKSDKSEEKETCNKIYNEAATMTGGITHLTCQHGVVKGFTAMKRGESVEMIVQPVVSRLPQRVQARRRYLLYDNACQARRYAERRYPHRVRHWTFLVDRKHWDNHTSCSTGYNMDEYPCLKKVNSQISEQTNRSLRKLSVVLAYYGWENYLRVIEIFLVTKNLKNKR